MNTAIELPYSLAIARSVSPSPSRSPAKIAYALNPEDDRTSSANARLIDEQTLAAVHTLLKQSPLAWQWWAPEHLRQVPPQSTSVSPGSSLPFSQGGRVQMPATQLLPSQSSLTLQPWPKSHLPHVPPQSTPVSSPLWIWSVHSGLR